MRAGLIAHDLIGGSAWAYMKIKLIYWVRGKRHILVSKATFSLSFFYCVTTRWNEYKMDGLLLLRANRPATKAISLLASGTWFFFFFFYRPSVFSENLSFEGGSVVSHTGGISSLSQPRNARYQIMIPGGSRLWNTNCFCYIKKKKGWHQMTSGCVLCSPCSFIMALHYKAGILNHPLRFLHHPSGPEWAHNAALQIAFDIQLAHLWQWPAHEGRHIIEKWVVMSVGL